LKTKILICGLAAISILAACGSGPSRSGSDRAPMVFSDGPPPARACLAEDGPDRAFCVVLIGAERTRLAGSKVCSPVPSDDLSDTYAVMDWIRAHPEAQDQELGPVIEKVLSEMHPCA
jgi:hypothetical protein